MSITYQKIKIPESKTLILAKDEDGYIVGKFCYLTHQNGFFRACGTSVLPEKRGRGIAKNLWRNAIEHARPTMIEVVTVSLEGILLVESLKKEYNHIEWEHIT